MDKLTGFLVNLQSDRIKDPKLDLKITAITLLAALTAIAWVIDIAIPGGF